MPMAILKKNVKQRRLEVRKNIPAADSKLVSFFSRPGAIVSSIVLLVFFLLTLVLDYYPSQTLQYRIWQYVPNDITARQRFRMEQPGKIEDAKRSAENSAPATFRLNIEQLDKITDGIEKVPAALALAKNISGVSEELRNELDLKIPAVPPVKVSPKTIEAPKTEPSKKQAPAKAASTKPAVPASKPAPTTQPRQTTVVKKKPAKSKNPAAQKIKLTPSQQAYNMWVSLAEAKNQAAFDGYVAEMRKKLKQSYIVNADELQNQRDRAAKSVTLVDASDDGAAEYTKKKSDLIAFDDKDRSALDTHIKMAAEVFPKILRSSVEAYLKKNFTAPMYVYDDKASNLARLSAGQAILADPPDECFSTYFEDTVIVPRSTYDSETSRGLQPTHIEILKAENEAYLDEMPTAGKVARGIARFMLLAFIVGMLGWYIHTYRGELMIQHGRCIALALCLIVSLAMVKFLNTVVAVDVLSVLLPVSMMAFILTIAFDQRFAIAVGLIMIAIMVMVTRIPFVCVGAMLATLLIIALQIDQIHQVRTRSRIPAVAAITSGLVLVILWALSMWNNIYWRFVLQDSIFAVASILFGGLIVQGILPVIEKIFSVATGSTLLEWCDASKPLLKRLAVEATGTYNHSLQLGSMCEAAAEAIGAQGLLARVGAYYHDIGKINKPEYFTENQAEGENKHEKLQPAMSLLIIQGHVKDGLELAREYNLPTALRDFIVSHHGTTLVQYFYHAATKKSEAENAPMPDEHQFRYPGPKPPNKETAILMLADAAESSVRALSDPTPSRIRQQVHVIVNARLEDGQLDECDITLKEVHKIEESLVRSLCGMYHSRVAYPDGKKPQAEQQEAQQKADSSKEQENDKEA